MEYEIKMDFYGDWISHLKNVLVKAGYTPATKHEDVSIQYFNLLRRLIPAIPRKILISKDFNCPPELQLGLNLIKEKINEGINLHPHLSRKILNLNYDDDLLNDWDIYHLHLGTTLDIDGFVKRTGPVLFVRFDEQNAYFINVMSHGSWTNQDMIRTIHRNWPESIERFRIKEAKGLNKPVTDKDIKAARSAHSFIFIEPEPEVIYVPPGMGLTTAGTGIEVVHVSNHYARNMKKYENVIKDNFDELIEKMRDEGLNPGKSFSFILKVEGKNVLVIEENHNLTIDLGELQ